MLISQDNVCNNLSFTHKTPNNEINICLVKIFNRIKNIFYVKIKPMSTVDECEIIYSKDNIPQNITITRKNKFPKTQILPNEFLSPKINIVQDNKSHKKKISCLDECSQKSIDNHVQNIKIEYLIRSINTDPEYIKTITRAILQAKMDIDECTFLESRQVRFTPMNN
jgi:hypothetical protein